ncbi:MAG: hypothetical protein U0401_15945 [Anaerolineae bacterium]
MLLKQLQHLLIQFLRLFVGIEQARLIGGVEIVADSLVRLVGPLVVESQQANLLTDVPGEESFQRFGYLAMVSPAVLVQ